MTAVVEKELVLPNQFVDVTREEMEYVDGGLGVTAVAAIITGAVATFGGTYAAGKYGGERAYHAGLRNSQYQNIKWGVRAAVIGVTSPILGGTIMLGFENGFYGML